MATQRPAILTVSALAQHDASGITPIAIVDPTSGAPAYLPPDRPDSLWPLRVVQDTAAHDVWLNARDFEASTGTFRRTGAASPERTALALSVFELSDQDLFITDDPALLRRRWQTPECSGIVSSCEAEQIVQTLFRARSTVLIPTFGGQISANFHRHAGDLARAMMPNTHRAMRSCLAPTRRGAHIATADHLEAVMTRQADAIRATQYVEELHYMEGHVGAGYDLLDHQLYELQNAIVLVSGSADIFAQVLLDLAGRHLPKRKVSWPQLLDPKSALRGELRNGNGALVQRATSHEKVATIRLAYKLRDVYQHRHSLRAGCH